MIPADDLQLTGISIQDQELTFSLVQPLQQMLAPAVIAFL